MTTTKTPTALDAARDYRARGWFPLPIPRGRKKPVIKGWQKLRLDGSEIERRFSGGPHNIGVLMGEPSGVTVADLDCAEALAVAPALLPSTRHRDGRDGIDPGHWWYSTPAGERVKTVRFDDPVRVQDGVDDARLVELLGNGAQCVVWPSIHPDGPRYRPLPDGVPPVVPYEEVRRAVARVAAAALLARYWPGQGVRHDFALALAGYLLGGVPEETVAAIVGAAARAAGDEEVEDRVTAVRTTAQRMRDGENVTGGPTLAEIIDRRVVGAVGKWLFAGADLEGIRGKGESRKKARTDDDSGSATDTDGQTESGDDAGEETEEPFHTTDVGNAERLVKRHGADLHYSYDMGKWLVWNGRRWRVDTTGAAERRAKETARAIYAEAAAAHDLTERKTLAAWAGKSEDAHRVRAMLDMARSQSGIPVTVDELDADPWLFNCRNGTIDLRTGALRPHDRNDLLTKIAPVEYDSAAECPLWVAFLDRVMGGDAALIGFLQRMTGYALTGFTSEHVLALLYGTGRNGKSTFIETLATLFGDYAKQADFSTFLARDGDPIRNDLARLLGARLVSAVEADAGRRLSEVTIKQLTGGDRVTARFLRQEFFEFTPAFKLFLAANHKPTIWGTDEGIWARIRLVPFQVTIPEGERDTRLPKKLHAELPSILAWAVRGCLAWQQDGLGAPPAVEDATRDYREEMDQLAGFIGSRCILGPRMRASAADLYRAYVAYCDEEGDEPLKQKSFGMRLTERGLHRRRGGSEGRFWWLGIGLRTAHDGETGDSDGETEPSEPSEPRSPHNRRSAPREGFFRDHQSDGSDGSGGPPQSEETQDFTDTLREDVLDAAQAAQWPRCAIRPGESVGPGEHDWHLFVVGDRGDRLADALAALQRQAA